MLPLGTLFGHYRPDRLLQGAHGAYRAPGAGAVHEADDDAGGQGYDADRPEEGTEGYRHLCIAGRAAYHAEHHETAEGPFYAGGHEAGGDGFAAAEGLEPQPERLAPGTGVGAKRFGPYESHDYGDEHHERYRETDERVEEASCGYGEHEYNGKCRLDRRSCIHELRIYKKHYVNKLAVSRDVFGALQKEFDRIYRMNTKR